MSSLPCRWKIKGSKTWSAILNSIQKVDSLDIPETPIKKRVWDTFLTPSPTKKPKLFTALSFTGQSSSSMSGPSWTAMETNELDKDTDSLDDNFPESSKEATGFKLDLKRGRAAGVYGVESNDVNPSPPVCVCKACLLLLVQTNVSWETIAV